MRRVMLVDDERPVLDGIKLLVRRDLAQEFEVVGTASSGREAIEKVAGLSPEIVLMDVSMPGLTGLDAIREIRKRSYAPVFILVTAYERFDIAREAVELGVVDYLLKPVNREKLALALRAADRHIEQTGRISLREYEFREREEFLRSYAEMAFLQAVMLGMDLAGRMESWRAALAWDGGEYGSAVCAAFISPPGRHVSDGDAHRLYERFRSILRFKTKALVGPLVAGRALALLPLDDPEAGGRELAALRGALGQELAAELGMGLLRVGAGPAAPLGEIVRSWHAAVADLGGAQAGAEAPMAGLDQETEFLDQLSAGYVDRAQMALDALLAAVEGAAEVPPERRYRLVGLLAGACRVVVQRGLLDPEQAARLLDLRGFEAAGGACVDGAAFCLSARAWFQDLRGRLGSAPQYSAPVARVVAWLRANYAAAISLEMAADLAGLSISRMSKQFIAETGMGFSEFLIAWRIERAKELLVQPGASIKQVSIAVGYADPNYFARLFKKETGRTPSAFAAGRQEQENE